MDSHNDKRDWDTIETLLQRKDLKFMTRTGIFVFPYPPKRYFSIAMTIFSLAVMLSGMFLLSMTIYKCRGDLMMICESLIYISILAAAFSILLTVFCQSTQLRTMLKHATEGIFTYEGVECEELKELRRQGNLSCDFVFRIYQYVLTVAFVSFSITTPIIEYLNNSSKRILHPDISFGLPVPIWFPINTDSTFGFSLAFLYELVNGFIVYQMVLAFDPLFVFLCTVVETELKILVYLVECLKERASEIHANFVDPKSLIKQNNKCLFHVNTNDLLNTCVLNCLKENIHHFNAIYKFFESIQNYFSFALLLSVGINMISLCTTAFVLSKAPSLLSLDGFKFCSFLIIEVFHTSFYCWFGTLVTTQSENYHAALYNCDWISFSEPVKRVIRILQIVSSNPLTFRIVGLFPLNLDTLVKILQNTYSVYNLLLNTNS